MVATRFAVATHIMIFLAATPGTETVTSLRLADSINTNPVVVRRITGQLARAGLVRVRRGPGGTELARDPERITLQDVWVAVEGHSAERLLAVHRHPNPTCPVGGRVRPLLRETFAAAEAALHRQLGEVTLARLATRLADAPA